MSYIPDPLAGIPLATPERSRSNYAAIRGRVPHAVAVALVPLLADSPDPDTALNLFERLTVSASPEIFRVLDRHRFLIHYAIAVFAHSEWLGDTLIQNTDIFHTLARDQGLGHSRSREEFREAFGRFRSRSFETDTAALIARFRKREYIRILLRDVLGIASLADTTGEISALSDVLIEEACAQAQATLRTRYGYPQYEDASGHRADNSFAVLSLGKLGGSELNYSSDIDLMYVYRTVEDAGTATITPREFYVRLAQRVTAILTAATPDGQPFRVDLRLRPQGTQGEAAIPLSHALYYYAHAAHGWERQAMIKARHSAGDRALAREFLRAVRTHVYTENLNLNAIGTMEETRGRIDVHRRRAMSGRQEDTVDIKVDRGGIRDIEFLVQCLQRVYGGVEPWLQSGGTLVALQKLHDKAHVSSKDFQDLTGAYEFLRNIEHRLQVRHGRQTHSLPRHERDLRVLARSLRGNAATDPVEFLRVVERRMNRVTEIYQRIIGQEQQALDAAGASASDLHPAPLIHDPTANQLLQRLANDSPQVHAIATRADIGASTRRTLIRFLSSAATSRQRYQSVLASPAGVECALQLFDNSEYLTDILLRYPGEVATLEQLRESGIKRQASQDEEEEFARTHLEESGSAMDRLRVHFRHLCFVSGALDLMHARDVSVSVGELSAAADTVITAALQAIGAPAGLAVLALGRLGSREIDLHSDADLIFVREESADAAECRVAAERLIEFLVAYTRQGTVFPVDVRLRPHGTQGELVITPAQLNAYFSGEAEPWEALSYFKLRRVAGSPMAGSLALESQRTLQGRFGSDSGLKDAVIDMRLRLERADPAPNLKTGPGGAYDIDFLCGYLQLIHGVQAGGTLSNRIHALRQAGSISASHAAELEGAARLYRTIEHLIRLVTGKPRKALPMAENSRVTIERLAPAFLGFSIPAGLDGKLARTRQNVRGLFDHLMGR